MSAQQTTPATAVRDLPKGTPVLAWPSTRDESPLVTHTRTRVWHVASIPVVSVDGCPGGIALTHVEVLPAGAQD